MSVVLTDKQADELVHGLLGTSKSVGEVLESIGAGGVEEDEALDQVADLVERCLGCDWWFEPSELDSEDEIGDPGYCDDCRQEME